MLFKFLKAIYNKVLIWFGFNSAAPSRNALLPTLNAKCQELVLRQQSSFNEVFCAPHLQSSFHQPSQHYDWWIFPMSVPEDARVSDTTRRFAINDEETLALLNDVQFISTYQQSIAKYLGNLENFGWNNYDIRFAKMLQSLNQFMKIAHIEQADPTIASIYQALSGLSERAIHFANNNIATRSPLLSQGLDGLNQALDLARTYTPARSNPSQTSARTIYGTRTKNVYPKINKLK